MANEPWNEVSYKFFQRGTGGDATGGGIVATSGPPTSTTATIANGASLSGAVQVSGKLVGIVIPAAWTSAAVTFQGSADNVNFYDIYDGALSGAAERTMQSASVVANRLYPLSLNDWIGVNYLKVRSGTSASPVNQGGARVFTLMLAG